MRKYYVVNSVMYSLTLLKVSKLNELFPEENLDRSSDPHGDIHKERCDWIVQNGRALYEVEVLEY